MKSLKLIAAAACALALAGTASAQSVIRISGSTAFRTSTHKAIGDILNTGYNVVFKNKGAGTSATGIYKASAAIFSGTLKSNGASVIIKTYWTGSLSGVVDLAQQNNLGAFWIANSELPPAHANGFNFDAGSYTAEGGTAPAQVSMSDNDKLEAAASVAGATGGAAISTTIKNAGLIDGGSTGSAKDAGTVGVVPFVWSKGVGAPASLTNVTQQVAAELIKTGSVPVGAFSTSAGASVQPITFTGGVADPTDFVFLVGRSEDSGTRIVNFAEPQTGFGKSCLQYRIGFSGGSTYTDNGQPVQVGGTGNSMTSLKLWDPNWTLNTAPSISWTDSGHAGYVGGGDVVNVLKATSGQALLPTNGGAPTSSLFASGTSKCYLMGYAGFADASGLPSTQRLTYNGVAYSVSNVQNGTYSLWSFEHLYYRPSLSTDANAKKAADDIADQLYTTDAPTNASGVTDNSGAIADVAGILYDTSFNYTKSATGAYLTPF